MAKKEVLDEKTLEEVFGGVKAQLTCGGPGNVCNGCTQSGCSLWRFIHGN